MNELQQWGKHRELFENEHDLTLISKKQIVRYQVRTTALRFAYWHVTTTTTAAVRVRVLYV